MAKIRTYAVEEKVSTHFGNYTIEKLGEIEFPERVDKGDSIVVDGTQYDVIEKIVFSVDDDSGYFSDVILRVEDPRFKFEA